jgi:hypothetical protein
LRVDKPQNEPRTGDAIDLGTFTSHPVHSDLLRVSNAILDRCRDYYNSVEFTT